MPLLVPTFAANPDVKSHGRGYLPTLDGWREVAIVAVAVLLLIVGAVAGRAPMLPLWLATLFPLLIVTTVVHAEHPSVRWLEWAPLGWLGRLSYSLYIWQTLFLQTDDAASRGRFPLEPLQRFPLNLPAAFLCAVGSLYLVERPAIRLGRQLLERWRRRRRKAAGCSAAG